jgi:hypothetical protein
MPGLENYWVDHCFNIELHHHSRELFDSDAFLFREKYH